MHVRFPFKNNILNYKVINWYYNSTGVYVVDLYSRRKNQNISVSTLLSSVVIWILRSLVRVAIIIGFK